MVQVKANDGFAWKLHSLCRLWYSALIIYFWKQLRVKTAHFFGLGNIISLRYKFNYLLASKNSHLATLKLSLASPVVVIPMMIRSGKTIKGGMYNAIYIMKLLKTPRTVIAYWLHW